MNPSLKYINYSKNLNYYCNGTATDPIPGEDTCASYFKKNSVKT